MTPATRDTFGTAAAFRQPPARTWPARPGRWLRHALPAAGLMLRLASLTLLLVGLASLAAPTTALAQPAPTSAGFAIRVIEGSKAPAPKVDPRLGDLKRELQTLHQQYNSFTLVSEQTLRLQTGARGAVRLPDGAEFAIHLLEFATAPVLRARHSVEFPGHRSTRSVAPGGRTLDVKPAGDKLLIICTTVER